MNERTKAALIGGVIAGVLSGLPLVGGCCFLWAIAGGFLTVVSLGRGRIVLDDATGGVLHLGLGPVSIVVVVHP